MAQTKGKHYWSELRSALTAGLWGSSAPAKAHNGSAISWSELLRKFNKHCQGYKEVSEIALQTRALALRLAGDSSDMKLDGDASSSRPLDLDSECMLSKIGMEEVKAGLDVLKQLDAESPNSDVRSSSFILLRPLFIIPSR